MKINEAFKDYRDNMFSEYNVDEDVFKIIRTKIDNAIGKVCETIIPIRQECYFGKGSSIAICTLSSMDLLTEIAKTSDLIDKVLIAGRLLSENKGIDMMIKFSIKNPGLRHIIVCGTDVKGHRSGQALLSLHENGVNRYGRILGATAPNPILSCSPFQIELFRRQTTFYNLIGTKDLKKIVWQVSCLLQRYDV